MNESLPEPYAGCSNFQITVESRERANLLRALQIVMTDHSKLIAYRMDQEMVQSPIDCYCPGPDDHRDRLSLFWADGAQNTTRLPYVLNTPEKAADFVWNWLEDARRGVKPDLDGSVSRDGWLLQSPDHREWQKAVTITAIWAEHHK